MSSPFSLDNTPHSGNASGLESSLNSDPESDVEPESTDRSPHSSTVSVTSTSSEAVLSSGWMLSGSYTIDHAGSSSRLEVPVSLLNALFQERARHSPVRMEHMIIFANKFCDIKNHLCTVSIRGYIYGKRAPMSVWKAWLGQDILWTPCSNIARSDEYSEDVIRSEEQDSPWFVVGKYGSRKGFQVQGTAFCFQAWLDIDVHDISGSEDCEASYMLQLVQKAFMDTVDLEEGDDFQTRGATFVLVQCDTRQLAHASAGSTVSVSIQGFIQCKRTDIHVWQHWIIAHWDTAPGGLCGFQMFEDAISESSTWTTIYEFGVLGKNNPGRKAAVQAAAQASGVQSRAPNFSFVRDHYSAVAAVQ